MTSQCYLSKYSWKSADPLFSKTIARRVSDPPGKLILMIPKMFQKNTGDCGTTFWAEFGTNPCTDLCFLSLVCGRFQLREECRAKVGGRGIFLKHLGYFSELFSYQDAF